MNFERYCGMASAAGILLALAIATATGVWGPLWQKMSAGDVMNLGVAVVGWAVTVGIGWRAFVLSQRQIKIAQDQIGLQQHQIDMQQRQIADDRDQLRRINYARLDAEFRKFAADIDRLATAAAYLKKLAERFPQGSIGGWAAALFFVRKDAADTMSRSAAAAPYGYGERVMTIIDRLQRLGDKMVEASPDSMPAQGTLMYFDPRVSEAVEGIRSVAAEIEVGLPARYSELMAIKDERDLYV